MEFDLVSIIIPVYNVDRYLEECILSVLKQTYHNIEIILVDDGSNDKSSEICDKYKNRDERIVVLHKKNGGLSDARNEGLRIATGKYISFIDSDDLVSPFFIEILMKVMKQGCCDVVALKWGSCFWDGEEIPSLAIDSDDYTVEFMKADKTLELMLYQQIATGAPFKIYKREIFDNIKFPVGYLYEDVATTYKTLLCCDLTAVVSSKLYAYRMRKNSIIRQDFSEKKLIAIDIFEQLFEDEAIKRKGLHKAAVSRVYAMLFSVYLQIPYNQKSLRLKVWNKLKAGQKIVMFDFNSLMRKKNRYAAWISLLGMNITYRLGKKFGQKGSMN